MFIILKLRLLFPGRKTGTLWLAAYSVLVFRGHYTDRDHEPKNTGTFCSFQ